MGHSRDRPRTPSSPSGRRPLPRFPLFHDWYTRFVLFTALQRPGVAVGRAVGLGVARTVTTFTGGLGLGVGDAVGDAVGLGVTNTTKGVGLAGLS